MNLVALCDSLSGQFLGRYQWETFLFLHPLEEIAAHCKCSWGEVCFSYEVIGSFLFFFFCFEEGTGGKPGEKTQLTANLASCGTGHGEVLLILSVAHLDTKLLRTQL